MAPFHQIVIWRWTINMNFAPHAQQRAAVHRSMKIYFHGHSDFQNSLITMHAEAATLPKILTNAPIQKTDNFPLVLSVCVLFIFSLFGNFRASNQDTEHKRIFSDPCTGVGLSEKQNRSPLEDRQLRKFFRPNTQLTGQKLSLRRLIRKQLLIRSQVLFFVSRRTMANAFPRRKKVRRAREDARSGTTEHIEEYPQHIKHAKVGKNVCLKLDWLVRMLKATTSISKIHQRATSAVHKKSLPWVDYDGRNPVDWPQ